MNIIHIITRLDRGGSSESLLLHAIFLRRKGERVVILSGAAATPEELVANARGNGVEFITLPSLVRDIRPLSDLRACVEIYRTLCAVRPDLVHTHTSKAGFLGRWAARLYAVAHSRRVPIIHSTHGHVFYGYYGRLVSFLFVLLEKLSSVITDRIVVLTPHEREEHLARGLGKCSQFRIVHSGISFEDTAHQTVPVRSELGIPENAFVVGSAGRLDPVKGYPTFIRAAGILNNRTREHPLFFLLIGDGSQRSLIDNDIRRYRLSGCTAVTGWVKNPGDYIAAVDIYVQPSLNEGLGKTILTAQKRGKPVIATRVQGIVSLIRDNDTGLLVPPGNAGALAEAIEKLAGNPALRERLGANARKAVEQVSPDTGYPLFSIEQMNYLFEQLYAEFLR